MLDLACGYFSINSEVPIAEGLLELTPPIWRYRQAPKGHLQHCDDFWRHDSLCSWWSRVGLWPQSWSGICIKFCHCLPSKCRANFRLLIEIFFRKLFVLQNLVRYLSSSGRGNIFSHLRMAERIREHNSYAGSYLRAYKKNLVVVNHLRSGCLESHVRHV